MRVPGLRGNHSLVTLPLVKCAGFGREALLLPYDVLALLETLAADARPDAEVAATSATVPARASVRVLMMLSFRDGVT
jgi:hypothetical protein